jgi:hypothetical protein
MLDAPNVAVSLGPFGTVAGVQLVAVLQSPLVGFRFQVALPAKEWPAINSENKQTTGKSLFIPQSQQKAAAISRQYEECELRMRVIVLAASTFGPTPLVRYTISY